MVNTYNPTSYQVVVPDRGTYVISANSFVSPATNAGAFGGDVTLTPVPEPTTFALMGVGGLLLAAPYLRRKARGQLA